MKILDIACGPPEFQYKTGNAEDTITHMDAQKFPGVDIVYDIEKTPLPFADKEFDMVRIANVLEHIHNINPLFDDIWRILKSDGIVEIIVAHHTNPVAKEMEHRVYWGLHSTVSRKPNSGSISTSQKKFITLKRRVKLIRPFGFLEWLVNKFPDTYEWRLCYFFPATIMFFTLKKVE